MVIRRNLQFAGKSNSFNSFSIYPTPPANTCWEDSMGRLGLCLRLDVKAGHRVVGGVLVHGPDDGQTGSVIRLLISALLEKEWQRHLQAINPCIIFSELRKHQSLPPPLMCLWPHASSPIATRTRRTGQDLLRGSSAPSPSTWPRLGQINGTAGRWAFKWAFLMGVVVEKGGRGVNEARSCFHPDLSASALQVSILWL